MSLDAVTEVDVLEQVCADLCAGVRTALPGIVVSYNPALRTAKVQPARRGRMASRLSPAGMPFDLPILPSCPVLWPRFGGAVISGGLNPGDRVLIIVSDRELDGWLLTGALYDVKSPRNHDLSDAMILPCSPSPVTQPLVGLAATGSALLYVGREDNLAYLSVATVAPPTATLQGTGVAAVRLGATAVSPVMMGLGFGVPMAAWVTAVNTAGTTWTSAAPQLLPDVVVFITAVVAATVTLFATIAVWQSVKVVAE